MEQFFCSEYDKYLETNGVQPENLNHQQTMKTTNFFEQKSKVVFNW